MTQAFTICEGDQQHAEGILRTLSEAFAPYRRSHTLAAYADTVLNPDALRQRLKEMTILVAVDRSGNVIGTVAYKVGHDAEGHIRGMAVSPAWHGTGVAEKLLDYAEAALAHQQCATITLHTTRPLQKAIRFYEKHGVSATGEVGAFFGMDLLAYSKVIRAR